MRIIFCNNCSFIAFAQVQMTLEVQPGMHVSMQDGQNAALLFRSFVSGLNLCRCKCWGSVLAAFGQNVYCVVYLEVCWCHVSGFGCDVSDSCMSSSHSMFWLCGSDNVDLWCASIWISSGLRHRLYAAFWELLAWLFGDMHVTYVTVWQREPSVQQKARMAQQISTACVLAVWTKTLRTGSHLCEARDTLINLWHQIIHQVFEFQCCGCCHFWTDTLCSG